MGEQVISRYGDLDVPEADDLIAEFLRAYGEWAYLETEFLGQNVPSDCRLFDIGAYVGTFSLGAKGWPVKSVVAVDANPAAINALTANLDRNLPAPHQIVMAVVGSAAGQTVAGRYTQPHNLGSLTFTDTHMPDYSADNPATVEAEVKTLQSLRSSFGDYDVLKLDVEGGERDVLESDAEWIKERRPTIWLECNEDVRVFRCLEFLINAGYDVHYFAFPSFNPENFNHNPKRIFPVAFEAGILAVPRDGIVVLPDRLEEAGCMLEKVTTNEELRRQLWLTPRWGMADWPGMSKSQLLGLCSRLARKHDYAMFLQEKPCDDDRGG